MDTSWLNTLVAVSLIALAVCGLLFVGAICTLIPQINNTLYAYRKLGETLNSELRPTLIEISEVVKGVNQIRELTTKRVSEVGIKVSGMQHKVEDVAGTVGSAAASASKQSSVWGAGLLAGVKAYLDLKAQQKEQKLAEARNKTLE